MKKFKSGFFYFFVVGAFAALIYWVISIGNKLEGNRNIRVNVSDKTRWELFIDSLIQNLQHPLAILLAQIVTIVFAARVFGWIFKKLGQPSVIGEIIAGIVMGPSIIGAYFPEFSATLFPVQSLGNLQFLSQIGLILFMFVIGMEMDLNVLKSKAKDAVVISHASIVFPFALGMVLAYFMYNSFAPQGIQFLSFSLFIGISMSVTAFPVLARIVQERGMHKTKLGTIVITCAAADDITAWCILAAVIAIVKAGSVGSAIFTILMAVAYVLLMINVVRPFLKRVADLYPSKDSISRSIVAIFFITLIISSYLTEIIGIHALFGAFMAGAIMPSNIKFRSLFIEKVEDVALVLLLPLFFVFTGLRTQIGLLNEAHLWQVTGIIILVAVAGKFIGSTLAAKFVGQNWKDSLVIGALMNTRGLMELVVLNIGYDLGVLTPQVFTMMVIMALVTTFMTGPALDLINHFFKSKEKQTAVSQEEINKYKILFSFETPEAGKALLKLSHSLVRQQKVNSELTALHLSPASETHHFDLEEYEKDSFRPIIDESGKLNQKVLTLFKVSSDFENEINSVAKKGHFDLLLISSNPSIYEGTLLGKILGFTTRIINPETLINTVTGKENLFETPVMDERTRHILSKSDIPVGILVDKNFTNANKVFIPLLSPEDEYLISYAQQLISNSGSQVAILDVAKTIENNPAIHQKINAIRLKTPNNITLYIDRLITKDFLQQQGLMIISLNSWKKLIESKSVWLSESPSTLIIAEKQ